MRIRGQGRHGQLILILCLGLFVALPAGALTVPPSRPMAAADTGRHEVAHHTVARAAAPASAPEVALQLQALLGEHALLAADLMRGRIRGDENFAQAADAALGRNTDGMSQMVGQLFGADAAKQFTSLWSGHIVELFTYAGGLADQDSAARDGARNKLLAYEEQLAAFFVGASDGRLTTDTATQAVHLHVDHLLRQADAYAAKDYATADRIYRESYQHTYDLGGALAGALFPPEQTAALQAPIWRLRSQLNRLLAEHVVLVEDLTRAAVTNAPDFTAAGQIINGNTQDLAAAVDSLFGAAAAKEFQSLWAYHVEQLAAYSSATAAQDNARRDQARTDLREFEARMAAFLESATGKRISSGSLSTALQSHDQMLMQHADAFAAKDYSTAQQIAHEAYAHMLDLSGELADAIGATAAARLPVGGAQTGYGGMAGIVERR